MGSRRGASYGETTSAPLRPFGAPPHASRGEEGKPMPVFQSQIDVRSDDYKRNREGMLAAIAEFRAAEQAVQAIAEKARSRFHKRKQLMPRERIALLVDPGAPFLELMGL